MALTVSKSEAITHDNVANFFAAMDQNIGSHGEERRSLAVTKVSFDISVLELFQPDGAMVVLRCLITLFWKGYDWGVLLTKTKVVLLMISLWAVGWVAYAYYYIRRILALPQWPYDAYAKNWQFQLIAFCIVRLPFLVALLVLLVALALILLRRSTTNLPEN